MARARFNILSSAAGDGLWFPILIDDERQRIKQWEMAREGRDERGAKGAGGRSDGRGRRIDGIFFTEGERRGNRPDLIRSVRRRLQCCPFQA